MKLSSKFVHHFPLSSVAWISLISCVWSKALSSTKTTTTIITTPPNNLSSLVEEYKIVLNDKLAKRTDLIWSWIQISQSFLALQLYQQATEAAQKALSEINKREKEFGASFTRSCGLFLCLFFCLFVLCLLLKLFIFLSFLFVDIVLI
jgi:hypothetical protein